MRRQSGGPPNMGGGGGGSQRQLAEQTEELARRLERLAREKSNPAMQETARRLQDAANAMRRSSTGGQGTGEADAKAALDRLRDARKRLENERTGRLDRDVQQALRTAEEMRQAQEKIAGEAEQEMGSRAGNGGSNGENGRLERLLERKDTLGSQVGELESQLDRMARDARATNKDAARKLQEAADGIRDRKLKDKIRYSKGVVKAGAAEQARQLEAEIGSDIGNLQKKLGEAAGAASASGEDKRMAALERMRGLVRGLESVEERLREGQPSGSQSGRAAAPGREGASDGGAQSASGFSGGRPGPAPRPDEARQLQRELRERAREAEALGRELGEGRPGDRGAAAGLSSTLREMRRFEDPRVYGEPRGLAELVASVVQGLKAAEFAMRREVEGPDREKLFLSGTQDLPPGWQALVEEYYRSLSRKPAVRPPSSR
jgi:outer membrane murein-binding lipoprotein Lpp